MLATNIRTGEVDLVNNREPAPYAQLGSVRGWKPALGRSLGWERLTFNTGTGPLRDVRVRQALCAGFDTGDIFTKIVHGIGQLGRGLAESELPLVRARPAIVPVRPGGGGTAPGLGRLARGSRWDAQSRRKAASDRIRNGRGHRRPRANASAVAATLERDRRRYASPNVSAVVVLRPFQSGGILLGGKFDVALSAYYMQSLDPIRDPFLAMGAIPPGGNNAAYWRNARVTALERIGAGTIDGATRKRTYDEVQHIVAPRNPVRYDALARDGLRCIRTSCGVSRPHSSDPRFGTSTSGRF